MAEIWIKKGSELVENELTQIGDMLLREFKVSLPPENQLVDRVFFLLKENELILAMGALFKVFPVRFNNKEFTLYAFANVVANEKGMGYGKRVVVAMKEYLESHMLTGIGFCMPKNRGFYQKCGFAIDTSSTHRFIYMNGEMKITNSDGQFIFYLDSLDGFMKEVLSHPQLDVLLPCDDLW